MAIEIKLPDGTRKTIRGSNQENVAFPSGLCAERTALFYIGSEYPDASVMRMVIVAQTGGKYLKTPIKPCGGCRQVIVEAARRQKGQEIELILYGEEQTLVLSERALMPFAFDDF